MQKSNQIKSNTSKIANHRSRLIKKPRVQSEWDKSVSKKWVTKRQHPK